MARTPSLPSPLAPFGNAGQAGFGSFTLSGTPPLQKELDDASEARYEIGLRYNNGQATDAEYQAAVARELAVARKIAASADESVSGPAKRHVAELENLQHDITVAQGEAAAAAAGPEAQLAYYQQELAGMVPGSTAYLRLSKTITDLQESLQNKHEADASRQASFEFQSAQLAWHNGTLGNEEYLSAYAAYVAAQKPGTAEAVNAQDSYNQTVYAIHRNDIVNGIPQGETTLEDLLEFDRQELNKPGLNPNSDAYNRAFDNYQSTQAHIYSRDAAKIDDDYTKNRMTATQALTWYKAQLVSYSGNIAVLDSINGRVDTFQGRVQDEQDRAAIDAYQGTPSKNPTMPPADFMAYAKLRAAAYPPGTAENQKWLDYAAQAKTSLTENAMTERYQLSQDYLTLQKFIADNSKPPASGTPGQKIIIGADGHPQLVADTQAPSVSEQEAWRVRQAEVVDAKRQLALLEPKIAAQGGFLSSQQMLDWYTGLQAGVPKFSNQWYGYQTKIDTFQNRVHAEQVLAAGGVKVSYPGASPAPSATPSGGGTATTGGTGSRTPGASVPAGTKFTMPATVGTMYGHTREEFKGGAYTSDQIDYVANRIAAGTGLDPRAVRIWVMKEQGHANNPLGVSQNGNDGQYGILAAFKTMDNGIDEAITWINTHGNMSGIKAAVGKSVQEQIAAIDASPWGPPYKGSLIALANQVGYTTMPKGAPATGGSTPAPTKTPGNGITIDQFLNGLGTKESGGNYTATNNRTGAYGKYQIMPSDWVAFASKYLHNASAEQTATNQEAVMRAWAQDAYTRLGSWQAVAHAWYNPNATDAQNIDPTKWTADETDYVTGVVRAGGGTIVGLPGAKEPGGPYTTPAGTGTSIGLREVALDASGKPIFKTETVKGVTRDVSPTQPVDIPTDMSGSVYSSMYQSMSQALRDGDLTATYYDSSNKPHVLLLPDDPEARKNLFLDLDQRNIDIAALQTQQYAGDPNGNGATAANYYKAAVQQQAINQINLLDSNYGGVRTTTDKITGQVIQESRGERANPTFTKATVAAEPMVVKGPLTAAGKADQFHPTSIQTNSLTPIASGIRVLDTAKRFIADMTALAKDAASRGDFDAALAYSRMATDAAGEYSQYYQQIDTYRTQAAAEVKSQIGVTDVKLSGQVKADYDRLQGSLAPGGELEADLAPLNDLMAKDVLPWVQTDSTGHPVFQPDQSVKLNPRTALFADQQNDGSMKITPKMLPMVPGPDGVLVPKDPTRIPVQIPDSAGKIKTVYVTWEPGVVGTFTLGNGQVIPVYGRVETGTGQGWVENPFSQGRWSKGPLAFDVSASAGLQDILNPDGSHAIQFQVPGQNTFYRLQLDPKTGNTVLVQYIPGMKPADDQIKMIGAINDNMGVGAQVIGAAGIGLDPSRNSTEQLAFQLVPGLNGAWPGVSMDMVTNYLYGNRAKALGQQIRDVVQGIATDPIGGLLRLAQSAYRSNFNRPTDFMDQGLAGRPSNNLPPSTLGPAPYVNPSPYNWQGAGFTPAPVVGSAAYNPPFQQGAPAFTPTPVVGSAGFTPTSQDMVVGSAAVRAQLAAAPPPVQTPATRAAPVYKPKPASEDTVVSGAAARAAVTPTVAPRTAPIRSEDTVVSGAPARAAATPIPIINPPPRKTGPAVPV